MKAIGVIFSLLFCLQTIAQQNTVFIELGGNAQGTSLNYERQLSKHRGLVLSIGIGLALVKEDNGGQSFLSGNFLIDPKLSLPVQLCYLFNLEKENNIELGLGYTWIDIRKNYASAERGTHNFIASLGYRKYFGKEKKWIWKANFSPILAGNVDSGIEFGFSPMIGIALGKRF